MANESAEPLLWEAIAWPDLPKTLNACGQAVLWPFGATEQHGPHLGMGVDTVIASSVCSAVSARTQVPLLPPLALGVSSGHSRRWPGTLSLTPQTLISIVAETGDWLVAAGVRRLFLINSHVTNFAPLRCGLELLRSRHDNLMIALIPTPEISPRVREIFYADGDDWHANDAETSLMLALRPDLVRDSQLATSDDEDRTAGLCFAHQVNRTSQNGVTGRPSLATAEKGRELFDMMVADLSSRISRALTEEPPLPFSC